MAFGASNNIEMSMAQNAGYSAHEIKGTKSKTHANPSGNASGAIVGHKKVQSMHVNGLNPQMQQEYLNSMINP